MLQEQLYGKKQQQQQQQGELSALLSPCTLAALIGGVGPPFVLLNSAGWHHTPYSCEVILLHDQAAHSMSVCVCAAPSTRLTSLLHCVVLVGMPAQGPPPPPRPEGARRQYGVCDRFIATGSCAYGDRCKFSHDPSLRQGGGMGGGMGGGAMGGAMGGGGMGGGGMPPPPRPGGMMGQGGPGGQMDGPGMRPGMGMGGGPDGFMPGGWRAWKWHCQ